MSIFENFWGGSRAQNQASHPKSPVSPPGGVGLAHTLPPLPGRLAWAMVEGWASLRGGQVCVLKDSMFFFEGSGHRPGVAAVTDPPVGDRREVGMRGCSFASGPALLLSLTSQGQETAAAGRGEGGCPAARAAGTSRPEGSVGPGPGFLL